MRLKKSFKSNRNIVQRETTLPFQFPISKVGGSRIPLRLTAALWLGLSCLISAPLLYAEEPVNPLLREFPIQVDPTALHPPTWWYVPGVTPLIWTMDPISAKAFRTTDAQAIKLKPGEYRFGTYTFSFAFKVTLDGTLDFANNLDQCVDGRGSQKLTIRCSHTQPYPQEPDYYDSQN